MGKAFLGAFVSLIAAVVIVGAMTWSLNDKSHQMVMDSDNLESLIELQKQSTQDSFYRNLPN